ncbi:hypothetical protein LWI29_025164 [Acer saccharum]|uniref:Uncharacterized protein n=1 Tax=Acer saccharum TaxID=4024 RepID=A0AA39SR14_ACESA|nr:hypothetical protein LWI29_025164 [Acer saccharum]
MSGKGENLNSLQLLDSSDTLDRKVTCKPTSFASDQDSDSLEKGKVSSLVKHKSKEGSTRSAGQVDNKKGCGEEDRVRKLGHCGKDLGGFKDIHLGCRKEEGNSLEPFDKKVGVGHKSLKVGMLSSCDNELGSKVKNKEGKVSVKKKPLTPELTPCTNSCLVAKGHTMKCRNLKSNFKLSWYLEEEISKAVKIGVALGFDFDNKRVGMADVFTEGKRKLNLGGLKEVKVQ